MHVSRYCGGLADVFVCLKKRHIGRDCRSSMKCSNCHGRHHSSICIASGQTTANSTTHQEQRSQASTPGAAPRSRNTSILSMFVDVKTPVLLQTTVTAVYNKTRPDDAITAKLILDSGSHKSYICAKSVAVSIKTFGSETERV